MRTGEEVFEVTTQLISTRVTSIKEKISDDISFVLEDSFWRDLQETLEGELCGMTMSSKELEKDIIKTFLANVDEIYMSFAEKLRLLCQELTTDVSQN